MIALEKKGVPSMSVFCSTQLEDVFDLITHNGITKYKTKNSKATLKEQFIAKKQDVQHAKGGLFVVRSKDDFTSTGVKGFIITSKEALIKEADNLTHWTPNIYRKYQYTNAKRNYIHGFVEENLQQVNTFVIDIDTKKYSVNDIVLTCLDESIGVPTLIVESERGYQVYFALEKPIFISNKYNFRSLKVAKRISNNLKRSLKNVEADQFCNDFGFFRIPKSNNIVFFQPEQVYSVDTLINWSMRQDDDLNRPLFVVPNKTSNVSVTQSEWFFALINTNKVKGSKGKLGRNNTMFTLALACFHDGISEEDAFNLLDVYNTSLESPLKNNEVQTIINSAYSGKYKGPKAEYVRELLNLHVPGSSSVSIRLNTGGWYKHKKKREDRKRSHYEEWEEDIINYLTVQKQDGEPFIWRTQKQLCEAINIPQSTLNVIIKQSKKIIRTVEGKGRGATTKWTTLEIFMAYIIQLNQQNKEKYKKQLEQFIATWNQTIEYNPASINAYNYLQELYEPMIYKGYHHIGEYG